MEGLKKKVIFFTSPEVGGAERMTITIAKMLDESQYDIKFYVIGCEKGNIVNFIPAQFPVGLVRIRNIWDFTTLKLVRLMRREKPQIVFGSLIYLNIRIIRAASWLGGIKVIIRNNIGMDVTGRLNTTLLKKTYPKADVVIAQQEEMREELIKTLHLNPGKVVTLHNPIDIQTLTEKANAPSPYEEFDGTKYVWVGRVHYKKGQDVLLKAFVEVKKKQHDAKLFFVGKYIEGDPYYEKLKMLARMLDVENDVRFVGYDSNPYRWVKHCDCFVQPSRVEGLPNALIEAMYLGKPVVATRCIPVVGRIVKEGYNGFVVNPEDYDGLSEAMLKAIYLKDFSMTYKSATKYDFSELF